MKTLLFLAAAAMGTAAAAQTADPDPTTTTEQSPDTEETSVYDGPDSYNPAQPPPGAGNPGVRSVVGTYRPQIRDSYPPCSETVRDNCIQTAPPG